MRTEVYKDPKYEITTRYTIEYLTASSNDGAQRWELYQHANDRDSSLNPWELLDKIEFYDMGKAWEFYMARLFDEWTYVVMPIFEEIQINGETVRETYIEESPTFHCDFRGWVNREMCDELSKLQEEENANVEMLSNYAEFVRKLNGEKHFMEFLDKKWKERSA